MAGHSHWAGIKHKKGANDAKRGRLFSKMSKLIMSAARTGGGDPEMNLTLKYAIDRAKAVSMPKDNIERAVLKGTGELEGETLEEINYEGYGPGGVAIFVEGLTDNRNRTGAEIRKIFDSKGGNLGAPNCVAWQFEKKGLFIVPHSSDLDGEQLFDFALDADAEDIEDNDAGYEISCSPENFMGLKAKLDEAGYETEMAEIRCVPKSVVSLDKEKGRKALRLMEALEDHEDVQSVNANFEIPPELLKELEES